MSGLADVLFPCLAAVALLFAAVWALSLALRDASIVDVFWGLGFVAIAAAASAAGHGWAPRERLVLAMVTLWGGRLALHLLWRNWGRPEDYRYRAMRRRHGARFPFVSLGTVFGLQAALAFLVSLPVQAAIASPSPARWTIFDATGVLLFAIGLAFEAIGDFQLARFKADPANAGRVMDRGLWAWTRHPNYFGDTVVWWGLFLVACATPAGALTLPGPALMTFLLLRVSGVALLERTIGKRRPGYADYVARTSAFLPRPPKRR
jgi:steroid 5-alpha reductase family enzyme